jgi:hypothetical protein
MRDAGRTNGVPATPEEFPNHLEYAVTVAEA